MGFGISKLSILPGRKEPSDKAENVTQVLFGEHYEVIESEKKWVKIKMAHDNYECWIDYKQHNDIPESDYKKLQEANYPRSLDLLGIVKDQTNSSYHNLPIGSKLPFFVERDFNIGESKYYFKGETSVYDKNNLMNYARLYLNAPYLWGGRTPFGIDCSGFAQMCYLLIGVNIPRDAYQQAEIGTVVSSISDIQEGDLAFFVNDSGRINHVGIMISKNQIIHASGQVRIDGFDQKGIFVESPDTYTHQFSQVRRII